MKNRILRENRLPGSESLTRPEDIPSMSMYLGELKRRTDRNTKLGNNNELEGIPGITTGRLVDIDKLDESLVKLDGYKDVESLRQYKETLEIKPKDMTRLPEELINGVSKYPEINSLTKERIELENYESIKDLDTTLEKLPADFKVDSLSEKVIKNTLNNQPTSLPDYSIGLNYKDGVKKLGNYKEELKNFDDSVEGLSDYIDRQNYKPEIETLPDYLLELQKNQNKEPKNLENYREDLVYNEKVTSLDKTREDIDYKEIAELDNHIESLNTDNEVKELPDSIVGIPGEIKNTELSDFIDRINYDDIDQLDKTRVDLSYTETARLEDYIDKISVSDVEELPNEILTIQKDDITELPDGYIGSGYVEQIGPKDLKLLPEDLKNRIKDQLNKALEDCNSEDELFNRIMGFLEDARGLGWNLETKLSSIMSTYLTDERISANRLKDFLEAFQNALDINTIGGRGFIEFNDIERNKINPDANLLPPNKSRIDVEELFYRRLYGDSTEKVDNGNKNRGNGAKTTRQALLEMTLDALVEARFIGRDGKGDVVLPGDNELVNNLVNSALSSFANKEKIGDFGKKAGVVVKDYVGTYYKKGQAVISNMLSSIDANSPINVPIDKAKDKLKTIFGDVVSDFTGGDGATEVNNIIVGGNYYVKPSNLTNPPKVKDQQSKWMDTFEAREEARRDKKSVTSYNLGNFFDDYWNWPSVSLTLEDLCPNSNSLDANSTLDNLYEMIKTSPYMTTPTKFGSMDKRRGMMTLDSNNHWEVVITPYVSEDVVKGNGGYSFLPMIEEINIINYKRHGVRTNYSKWVPITSFNLQKSRLTTKNAQLYSGEIVYPTAIELSNELQLTIADDAYKSWRSYFEKCMEVSVYNSIPHTKDYYDGYSKKSLSEYEDIIPTVVDKNFNCIAFYKNITFNIIIYIMSPQLNTLKKYNLLCVLKEFSEEYSGDIDGGGGDLNISFSIVGELDAVEYDDNSEEALKIEQGLLDALGGLENASEENSKTTKEGSELDGLGDQVEDVDAIEAESSSFGKNTRDTTDMEWLNVLGANNFVRDNLPASGLVEPEKHLCARWTQMTLGRKHPGGKKVKGNGGELTLYKSITDCNGTGVGEDFEKLGWYCIGTGTPPSNIQAGDIMCVTKFKSAVKDHPWGHAAYFNGKSWSSDFRQKSWNIYSDATPNDISTHYSYWRWPKRIMPNGSREVDAQYIPIQGTSTQCDRDDNTPFSSVEEDEPIGKNTKTEKELLLLEVFNVDSAIELSKTYPTGLENSAGDAATKVSDILRAGNLSDKSYNGLTASNWSGEMEESGWYLLCKGWYPLSETPKAGDLMTIDEDSNNYPFGHVAFFNGERWVSDFQQNGYVMYGPDNSDSLIENYKYWRWPRRLYNGIEELDKPEEDDDEPEPSDSYISVRDGLLEVYRVLAKNNSKEVIINIDEKEWKTVDLEEDEKVEGREFIRDAYNIRSILETSLIIYLKAHEEGVRLSEEEQKRLINELIDIILGELYEVPIYQYITDLLISNFNYFYLTRGINRGDTYAVDEGVEIPEHELNKIGVLLKGNLEEDEPIIRSGLGDALAELFSSPISQSDSDRFANKKVCDAIDPDYLSIKAQKTIIENSLKAILRDLYEEELEKREISEDVFQSDPVLRATEWVHRLVIEAMSKTDEELKSEYSLVFDDEEKDTVTLNLLLDEFLEQYNKSQEVEFKVNLEERTEVKKNEVEYCLERLGYREEVPEIVVESDYDKAMKVIHPRFFEQFNTMSFKYNDKDADIIVIGNCIAELIREVNPLLSEEDKEAITNTIIDEALNLLLYNEEKDENTGNRPIYDKCLNYVETEFGKFFDELTEEQIKTVFNLDDKVSTQNSIRNRVYSYIKDFENYGVYEESLVEFEKKKIVDVILDAYIFRLFPDNSGDINTVFGRAYWEIHKEIVKLLEDEVYLLDHYGIARGDGKIDNAKEKLTQFIEENIDLFNSNKPESEQLSGQGRKDMIDKELEYSLTVLEYIATPNTEKSQIYNEDDEPSMKIYKYALYLMKLNNYKMIVDLKGTLSDNEADNRLRITEFIESLIEESEDGVYDLDDKAALTQDEIEDLCSTIRPDVVSLIEKV